MTRPISLVTSDSLTLEGEVDAPRAPKAVLVLCHPHPKMGGTMNAPLLLAVRERMVELGWAVVRFNFRGIGRSEGVTGVGIEECKDAEAALALAHEDFGDLPVAISGWSFGAAVAVRVAVTRSDLVGCLGIAPAVRSKPGITAGMPAPGEIRLDVATHLIVGANDDLVDPADCVEWAKGTGASCSVMKGANHFFWAKYDKLADEVGDALERFLER